MLFPFTGFLELDVKDHIPFFGREKQRRSCLIIFINLRHHVFSQDRGERSGGDAPSRLTARTRGAVPLVNSQ